MSFRREAPEKIWAYSKVLGTVAYLPRRGAAESYLAVLALRPGACEIHETRVRGPAESAESARGEAQAAREAAEAAAVQMRSARDEAAAIGPSVSTCARVSRGVIEMFTRVCLRVRVSKLFCEL